MNNYAVEIARLVPYVLTSVFGILTALWLYAEHKKGR